MKDFRMKFATGLNLSAEDITVLESLTPEQLLAIRRNVRVTTDQEALDAAAQYMADGGDIADLDA